MRTGFPRPFVALALISRRRKLTRASRGSDPNYFS